MHAGASEEKMKKGIEQMLPQLHTTVAVTGWLRDNDIADFQLAWGYVAMCFLSVHMSSVVLDSLYLYILHEFYHLSLID